MKARKLSEAERLRRHNDEMRLALAENLPLAEARRRLNFLRGRAARQALDLVMNGGPRLSCRSAAAEQPAPRYWWLDERL